MATTAHSTISAHTVMWGTPIVRYVNPASTYKPGDAVYLTAAATATALDSDTAVCKLVKPFFLEFKPRIASTMARKDCDDTYATTDSVPMIIAANGHPIRMVGHIADPGAAKQAGHTFMASATANVVQITAGAGTADIVTMPIWNAKALANGDTYAELFYY